MNDAQKPTTHGPISWSWRHAILQSDLKSTTRHVLLTLSCFMNDMGKGCYPTTRQLAECTDLSQRAVCEHLEIAAGAGWIRKKRHGFAGQKWANNEYEAAWPTTEKVSTEDQQLSDEGEYPHDIKVSTEDQSKVPIKASKVVTPIIPFDLNDAVSAWNVFAEDNNLSKVQKLTKARQSKLKARLKDAGGIDGWNHAIVLAGQSDFLMGRAGKAWAMSFDFLCQESSFTKLMEGAYENRGNNTNGNGPDGRGRSHQTRQMDAFARVAMEADQLARSKK